ncbi:MAG: lysoplasmalogenase [Myxococcales bacterium]|nr:lysoplasmalogenase [Myxococcales bacterium]
MGLNAIGEWMTVLGLAVLLYGEWRDRPGLRAAGKPFASLGFIVAALGFGALESRYGKIVLLGLILGAIGDVCLLGSAKRYFIAGLVAFLLGHVAYVVAFAGLPLDATAALLSAALIAVLMVVIARWVFPHAPDMRGPIGAYMLVISAMCVVAVGAGGAGAPWMVPVGALMFTASDIAVVRDRFVSRGFVNRLWGLPLYYAAQLIIAWSIRAVSG